MNKEKERLFHEQAKAISGIVYATKGLDDSCTMKQLKEIVDKRK